MGRSWLSCGVRGIIGNPRTPASRQPVQAGDDDDAENAAEQLVELGLSGQLTGRPTTPWWTLPCFVRCHCAVAQVELSAVVAAMVDEFDGPSGQAQVEESVKQLRLQSQNLADYAGH